MNYWLHQKGLPGMDNTELTAGQTTASTQHLAPSSPSLAQQIVTFLEWALLQSPQERTDVVCPGKRARGAPPKLPMQQLWLAVLVGSIRPTKLLSSILRNLCLESTGSFPAVQLNYQAPRE